MPMKPLESLAEQCDRPSKPTFLKIMALSMAVQDYLEEHGEHKLPDLYVVEIGLDEDGALCCDLTEDDAAGFLHVSDHMDMLLAELRRFPDACKDGWPFGESDSPEAPAVA